MNNLQKLINEGFFISPEIKDKILSLSESQINFLKEKLLSINEFNITKNLILNLFPNLKILKNLEEDINQIKQKNGIITIYDYTQKYFRRWSEIQKILSEKVDLKHVVSISNASGECILIGIVFRKKENFFELEDPTGIIKVDAGLDIISKISEDDIIAVSGLCIEDGKTKKMNAKEVIYPDIQIHKQNLLDFEMSISFQENIKINTDIIFVYSEDKSSLFFSGNEIQISDPCLLEINGIKIFYYIGNDYPINILKKRFVQVKKLDFILDIVPDIFITNAVKDPINYKGVSVLPLNYKMNLKTGEKTKII